MCHDYLTETATASFSIIISEEDVEKERKLAEGCYPYGYLESLAVYRKFCEQALDYGVLLFHASAVSIDGEAYLFTAPSGTGKSTHTKLWREYFGTRAVMINDDKPLLRFADGRIYTYGTPWDGKHHLSTNIKSEVKAICILERADVNRIDRLGTKEAYPIILNQTYRSAEKVSMIKTLQLVDRLMTAVPIYKLGCTISEEAVQVAYEGMRQ